MDQAVIDNLIKINKLLTTIQYSGLKY
jgi:hypothetical protein